MPVEFWSAINIRTKEVMDFREAAQKIRDGEAEQGDFRYYNRNFHVFNAAQIEGMPELKRVTPTADIGLIRQNRDTLIKNMAVGFDGNGADCHYSPAQDKIVMPPESDFRDTYGYMCSFLHEAGHATGAPGRLGRGFGSTREEYAIEELRAEIASAMTSQQLGIPLTEEQMQSNLDLHKAYIQGWAQAIKDAPKVLFDAIKDAEQISDYLIDKGKFRQVIEAEQVKEAQEPGAMEEASRDHGEDTVKQITVLVVEPGKVPYTKEIGDDWRAFQAEVGGTFQIIYPGYDPVGLVCNDDGKLLGLPLNRGLLDDDGELYDVVAGTFFLVGLGGGGTTVSLTDDQIRKYEQRFHDPEQFIRVNNKLVSIPLPGGAAAAETLDKKPITKMDFSNKGNQYFAEITIEGRTESCPIRCSNGVRWFDRQNQQIEREVVYSFTTSDGVLHRLSPENAECYKSFVEQTVKSQAVLEQAKQPHEPSEEVKAKAL